MGQNFFVVVLCWFGSKLKLIITFHVVVDLILKSLHYHYSQYYFII
jgi:hypothetical protein